VQAQRALEQQLLRNRAEVGAGIVRVDDGRAAGAVQPAAAATKQSETSFLGKGAMVSSEQFECAPW